MEQEHWDISQIAQFSEASVTTLQKTDSDKSHSEWPCPMYIQFVLVSTT